MTTYDEIRRRGNLFVDRDFPAIDESLFFSGRPPRPIQWLRPSEICDNPQFLIGGASRLDVKEGILGDSWLLAAIASLASKEKLLQHVCPQQSFTAGYCGVFKFMIWQYGEWTEVVIDDRLPTYDGKLIFLHSTEKNEFWSALLEKAYAKLCGSYEAMKGGMTSEALEDFTGGVAETFFLGLKTPKNLFAGMLKAVRSGALMGCSKIRNAKSVEEKPLNGLVTGLYYSVTGVRKVSAKTTRGDIDVELVRIRNPWGNEREWTGAWGDKSAEWSFINDSEKDDIGLTIDHDGEFWMSFRDFITEFTTLEICNLGPDSLLAGSEFKAELITEKGRWVKGYTAGGCRNFIDTFATNPQYRVRLTDSDDDEDDLCTVVIALMQKDRRKMKKQGGNMLTIGYVIYKIEDDAGSAPLDKEFFMYNESHAKSPAYTNAREVCGRFRLKPGIYVVMGTTFDPNLEGEFLLRIFTEKAIQTQEMDVETSHTPPQTTPALERDEDVDSKFRAFFEKLAGEDKEIDQKELNNLLSISFKQVDPRFTDNICQGMIIMMDRDQSGKLGFEEFKEIWKDIMHKMRVFTKYDKDKSGTFDTFELREAFKDFGICVSNKVLTSVHNRFVEDGKITFANFVSATYRLLTVLKTFNEKKIGSNRRVEFGLDEFMAVTMIL